MQGGTPDAYYRVSAKALVFDGDKLLVFKDENDEWEMPGGGWNHNESLEDCLRRELQEEVGVAVDEIDSEIIAYWRDEAEGVTRLKMAVKVTITSHDFTPQDDDLVEARFVTKQEFLQLPFQESEKGVVDCVDKIWP